MRYRLLASYQGAPYEAGIGPGQVGVVLFAACPPPEDLHFEPATGHWRKTVRRDEVQSLYESRPVGLFRGERCVVLDDLTDRLHIAYLGHDALKAEQLGYWEVDRGVFELIAPRHEVMEVVEQRLPIAERADDTGQARPAANGSAASAPAGLERSSPYPAPGHAAGMPGPAEGAAKPGDSVSRSGYGSPSRNGQRPGLLPPDSGRGVRSEPQDRPAADSVPRADDLPRYAGAAGGSGPRSPGQAEPVSVPAAESAPLPLEAQAMRAATAAVRRGKESGQAETQPETRPVTEPGTQPGAEPGTEPGTQPGAQPGTEPGRQPGLAPVIPLIPAGLSEPSMGARSPRAGTSAVPSWSPHPLLPPQRADQQDSGRTVPAPGHGPEAAGYGEPAAAAARNGSYGRTSARALADAPPLDPYRQDRPGRPATDPLLDPEGERPRTRPGLEPPVAVDRGDAAATTQAPPATHAPPMAPASAAIQAPAVPAAPATEAANEPAKPEPADLVPAPGLAPGPDEYGAYQYGTAGPRASRRRRSAKRRLPTQRIFSELAGQAGIPEHAYAIGEDVEGAMCLVQTGDGFEVFNSLGGARHEVRAFADEESAYFYLFGVLAAEAVRTGSLGVVGPRA